MSEVGARQAAERAGITYRQFDFWVRRGWIKVETPEGEGSGRPRLVQWHEVEVLRLMGALVAAGVEPEVAAGVARRLRATGMARLGTRFVIREVPPTNGGAT